MEILKMRVKTAYVVTKLAHIPRVIVFPPFSILKPQVSFTCS